MLEKWKLARRLEAGRVSTRKFALGWTDIRTKLSSKQAESLSPWKFHTGLPAQGNDVPCREMGCQTSPKSG